MKLRRIIFHLHLYLGLLGGLLLSLTGLTGSVLVFRHEIDAALYPRLHGRHVRGAEQVSPQRVLDRVRAAFPGAAVQQLAPPRRGSGSYVASLKGGRDVFVSGSDGTVLGSRMRKESLTGFLFDLHAHLLSGDTGETWVGVGGIALLLLGLSGMWLWWPGVRKLRHGLTVRWRGNWKRTNYDLHRVGGLVAFGVLGLVAFTGVTLVFGTFFTDAAYRMTGLLVPEKPRLKVAVQARPLALDRLLARAHSALPFAEVTRISLPAKPEAPLVVRGRLKEELHPNGMSFVHLDPYSGAVLRVESAPAAPLAGRLLQLRFPLHIGAYGGLLVRILYALAGLMPGVLFATGSLMWWNRYWVPHRRRRSPATARPLPELSLGGSRSD